jgi:hypothetical protein
MIFLGRPGRPVCRIVTTSGIWMVVSSLKRNRHMSCPAIAGKLTDPSFSWLSLEGVGPIGQTSQHSCGAKTEEIETQALPHYPLGLQEAVSCPMTHSQCETSVAVALSCLAEVRESHDGKRHS